MRAFCSWRRSIGFASTFCGSDCGSREGGLVDEVVALRHVRGPAGGLGVRFGGGGMVAVELVKVPAHGMPPVALADHLAKSVRLP